MIVGCASPQSNRPFAKRKQAMNDAKKRFKALDVDGDGELSLTEFTKSQAAQRSADPDNLFNSADTNTDGALTFDELRQALSEHRSKRNWYSLQEIPIKNRPKLPQSPKGLHICILILEPFDDYEKTSPFGKPFRN